MTTNRLIALPLAALALCGCSDGLDTDRISSEIELSPSLLLPMTTSTTSVEFLYEEQEGGVEYYIADDEDKTNRIRFRANRDKAVALSLYDIIGLDAARSYRLATIPLSEIDPQSAPEFTFTTDLEFYDESSVSISSIDCQLTVGASWDGFSAPMGLTVSVAETPADFEIATQSGADSKTSSKKIALADNKIPLVITCRPEGGEVGSLGNLNLSVTVSGADNVVCKTQTFRTHVNPVSWPTQLDAFRQISKSMLFENPQLWLACQNGTGMDMTVSLNIRNAATDGTTLSTDAFHLPSKGADEVEFNRENSDISAFLHPVPTELYLSCDAAFSMPEGAESVTIHLNDSAFFGYRYNVPFDFAIDGTISEELVDLSDLPENDHVDAAKIVVTSDNSLPFRFSSVATFIEKGTGNRLSQIELPSVIDMPELSEWGTSAGGTVHKMMTVELTDENLDDLRRSDRILFSTIASSDGIFVAPKLEDKANIDIALAVKFVFSNK